MQGSSAGLHATLQATKAVIAGTPPGKDVLTTHLSDAIIYQGTRRLPVACKLCLTGGLLTRVIATLAVHRPSITCTNTALQSFKDCAADDDS